MSVRACAAALALFACTPKASEEVKADVVAQPLVTTAAASSPSSAATPGGKLVVQKADADTDAISTIRTARLRAKAQGRVLVVFVSATWCDPCKKMKAEIEAGHLDARFGRTTLLAFDADNDSDRLKAAGYAFEFVPFVALAGRDGTPADARQATGHGEDAWKELLGKLDAWQAAGPL